MWRFTVTYETNTPESAETGDVEESGFVARNVSLRDAVELIGHMATEDSGRWFTNTEYGHGTRDYYENGRDESRSLHVPEHITPASYRRIARLLGV